MARLCEFPGEGDRPQVVEGFPLLFHRLNHIDDLSVLDVYARYAPARARQRFVSVEAME